MLFLFGVQSQSKDLGSAPYFCPLCRCQTQLAVCKTCETFTAYFFPLFRWNTLYFATAPCCGAVYALDREIGKQLERGVPVVLLPQHLQMVQPGTARRACPACGARVPSDAAFCPRCGKPLT